MVASLPPSPVAWAHYPSFRGQELAGLGPLLVSCLGRGGVQIKKIVSSPIFGSRLGEPDKGCVCPPVFDRPDVRHHGVGANKKIASSLIFGSRLAEPDPIQGLLCQRCLTVQMLGIMEWVACCPPLDAHRDPGLSEILAWAYLANSPFFSLFEIWDLLWNKLFQC